ncbi:hypothetical protein [Candidatus Electronema sp. TJ]|uniref:hypothetical protein n=1 Tax=Candidatus Electronema sp. TJ TaxID=3401573 RepID=UPI003AA8B0C2
MKTLGSLTAFINNQLGCLHECGPIFQGLAISLMAGEAASLLFSRMTVPVLYFLEKRWEHQHSKA